MTVLGLRVIGGLMMHTLIRLSQCGRMCGACGRLTFQRWQGRDWILSLMDLLHC